MNNSNVKHNRDIAIDVMKGIGILLVLLGHVWGLPTINHVITSFDMPMFFIVAGYFSKSYDGSNSVFSTIGKYAKRLIPPYLVTMVLITLWSALKIYVQGNDWSGFYTRLVSIFWADVNPLHLSFGDAGIGVVWFLLALFWAKVLLLIITKWEKWVLPVSILLSIGALLLHRIFPYSVACISLGLIALPFVAIGWWIKHHPFPWCVYAIGVIAWVVAILFSELDLYEYRWGCYPLDVLGACGGTCALYVISKGIALLEGKQWMAWIPKMFAYLGTISLAIMCVHCFEIDSHLGNHLRAAIGWDMPIWGLYVWRYSITIVLAIALTKIPKIKSIFV